MACRPNASRRWSASLIGIRCCRTILARRAIAGSASSSCARPSSRLQWAARPLRPNRSSGPCASPDASPILARRPGRRRTLTAHGDIELPWAGDPPEPFATPEYYRGVLVRRVFAYWVDLLMLGLIPIFYHTLTIGGPRSATPGMSLTGVEVRSWTGERPNYLQAFVQTILFYVTVYPTWSLVLLIALFNERRRTLHDILAGTLVIRHPPVAVVLRDR